MHNEFKLLENGNIEVINEKGETSKHNSNINENTEEILLTENKIEIINDKLNNLNKKLDSQEGVIKLSKYMMILQPFLVVLFPIATGIIAGLSNIATFSQSALFYGIHSFIYGVAIATAHEIYYGVIKKIYNKKIKGTNSELEKANSLKEEFENELSNLKEINNNKNKMETNKNFSLTEKNNSINIEIENELKNAYDEGYKSKSKKLTLKK